MHAEIIAVGTEITTGAKLDTNSQWLSLELAAVGIPVKFQTTVADDLEAMLGVLQDAVNRSDVVLVTGGLGPTLDDLTRQCMAELVQSELVLHEPSLEFIKAIFAHRKREMPERNVVQAMFPEGSTPLANPRGSAPGIWMEVPREGSAIPCQLAAMPGVPSEMKRMFRHEVLPRLPAAGGQVIRQARVNCFGTGESHTEERLGDLTARGGDPEIGITAHEATITLRITAHASTETECDAKIAAAKKLIYERMGDFVFSEEDDELEHVVVRLLGHGSWTLSTVEAGTGGLLAHRLTEVAGSENCFLGGIVAATGVVQRDLLDMKRRSQQTEATTDRQTAIELADACRKRFRSDFALAVTECPRFDPDNSETPAPTSFVALAGQNVRQAARQTLAGDPAIAQSRTVKAALNLLRLYLIQSRESSTES